MMGPNGPITDPALDGPGSGGGPREIVGPNDPAVYLTSDGTNLFFRIRLDASPLKSPGQYVSFGWGCEINVSPNPSTTYQWLVMLDGTSGQVLLEENTAMTTLDSPGSSATGPNTSYAAWDTSTNPAGAGYSETVAAPTAYNNNPDAFVDFAVPLAALDASGVPSALQVTSTTAVRFVCGSSSNTRNLTGDLAGSAASSPTLTGTLSNPYVCGPTGCTMCNTSSACGPTCMACTGTQVCSGVGGTCVQCNTNADCPLAAPSCNTSSHTCSSACTGDGAAGGCPNPSFPACQTTGALAGTCTACSVTNTTQCSGATPLCNTTTGRCVQCTSDASCAGTATPACNTTTGRCVQCTAASSGACSGTTPVCEPSDTCGCDQDTQCGGATSGMICDGPSATCVAGCRTGSNGCPSGQDCVVPDGGTVGACVASPGDGGVDAGSSDAGDDGGALADAGDGGALADAGDGGALADAGDGGALADASRDGAAPADGGNGGPFDASFADATTSNDSGASRDGAPFADGGSLEGGGCACSAVPGDDPRGLAGSLALLGMVLLARRRNRRR